MVKKIILFLFLISVCILNLSVNVHAETKKTVYLTFDDGPSKNTLKILTILNKNNIHATFFLVGENIDNTTRPLVQRLSDDGHYIGLHTMKHRYNYLYRGKDAPIHFINEILEEQALIYALTGERSTLVRPPFSGGSKLTDKHVEQIMKYDLKVWDWNIDSKDWSTRSVAQIIRNINRDLKLNKYPDVAVVLMHEKNVSVKALPLVIELLKNNGYSFEVYNPEKHFPVNFRHIQNI